MAVGLRVFLRGWGVDGGVLAGLPRFSAVFGKGHQLGAFFFITDMSSQSSRTFLRHCHGGRLRHCAETADLVGV